MDEKLKVDILESTEEKPDISHIPNSMFDQNVNSFTKGETMNRDYLHQLYGESMDFLNKEVRLTRTKYYEMREKIEKGFDESVQHEKKKMIILAIVFFVFIIFAIISFCVSAHSFDMYQEMYLLSFNEYLDKSIVRGYWAMGGLFFGIGWIVLVTSVTMFSIFLYSTIKNIKQYKKKKERALKNFEDNKHEQMLLGLYDAGR